MAVRRATGADVSGIRRVAERSWARDYPSFLTRETIAGGVEEWYSPESIRADLGNPEAVVVVATAGDEVVGFAHGHRSEDTGHLLRVYVDPDHRREGVAMDVVTNVFDAFHEAGVDQIRAMVLSENEQGRAFYRALGMTRVDTETTTIDGERHEEAVFELSSAEDRPAVG
ncbi:MAG: N-acetyltransferase family protein [Halanaeroarchaeum sp.]